MSYMSKLSKKRILITGATGFIGANLTRALVERNCEVAIFSRAGSDFWRIQEIKNKLKKFNVDLRQFSKVKDALASFAPEIIFHFACYGGYAYQANMQKMVDTNILGSFNLLKAATEIGPELFINVGSSSEYGKKNHMMREADMLEPINIYGATKASATLLSDVFFKSFKLPVVNVRLFSPYGYYEDINRFIPFFIRAALNKKALKLTSGRQKRDFMFIEDAVSALLSVVRHKKAAIGQVINISSGQDWSLRQVAEVILKELNYPIQPCWGNLAYRDNEAFSWQADIKKAKKLLNWRPKYNLKAGLTKTINWFRNNLWRYE